MPAPTPTDSAVQAAVVTTVRGLIEDCEAPVAFGGAVNTAGDGFGIAELAGTHGRSLSGLQIRRGGTISSGGWHTRNERQKPRASGDDRDLRTRPPPGRG